MQKMHGWSVFTMLSAKEKWLEYIDHIICNRYMVGVHLSRHMQKMHGWSVCVVCLLVYMNFVRYTAFLTYGSISQYQIVYFSNKTLFGSVLKQGGHIYGLLIILILTYFPDFSLVLRCSAILLHFSVDVFITSSK